MHWYLVAGFVLGALLILAHAVRARGDAQLERAVVLFLAGVTIPIGGRLIYVATTAKQLHPFDTEERIYIVIGGIAMIWVSAKEILRELGVGTSSKVTTGG